MARPPPLSVPPEFLCAARRFVLLDAQGIPSPGRDRRRRAPTRLGQRGHSADELRVSLSHKLGGPRPSADNFLNSSELCSIRQTKWCPRPLRTCSGSIPVLSQKLLNCFHDRLLDRKDAFRIYKRFRRIIEVDVFDIEIRNQCVAVPKRPADFETTIQKRV